MKPASVFVMSGDEQNYTDEESERGVGVPLLTSIVSTHKKTRPAHQWGFFFRLLTHFRVTFSFCGRTAQKTAAR
jgi:hypothetical protein